MLISNISAYHLKKNTCTVNVTGSEKNKVYALCSRLTLSETDNSRRESYKQQQVVHFMVERSPSQTIKLGSHNRPMTEHHLPFFNTTRDLHDATTTFKPPQQQQVIQKLISGVGKQEATTITQDLSKPVRINFRASSLMSSPREISDRTQRREWWRDVDCTLENIT